MDTAIGIVFKLLPLIFGLGFLAPVIASGVGAVGMETAFGLPPLTFGFLIGGVWGLGATFAGRWV